LIATRRSEPPPTRFESPPTLQVFGDYELIHEIARGGMGVVWKARQRRLNRIVALKMIQEGRETNDDTVQRFLTEARAASNLDHPNIVAVYDANHVGNRHYFTMAYVDGKDLAAVVAAGGPLPIQDAAAVVRAVADAIAYAHSNAIIHRDLKPSNVLIDSAGRPRVTDFGLAKCLSEVAGLTVAGQVLGTPAFMAPEQALARNQEVGPPADIYALGGLLYFLLVGNVPFDGDSAAAVLHQVAYEPPTPPRQCRPEIPAELEAICLRCLAKEPANRYASAAEVAQALTPWCASSPSSTRAPASPDQLYDEAAPPPQQQQRSGGWLLPAVLMAASAAAVAALVWYLKQPSKPTDSQVVVNPPPTHQAPAPATAPRGPDGEAFNIEPKFHDFDLPVELVGLRPGPQGDYRVTEDQGLQFRVRPDRDVYVGIWSITPSGTIRQLFPNKFEPEHFLPGGKAYLIPGEKAAYEFGLESTGGTDRIYIAGSTVRWEPFKGQEEGPFVVLKTREQRKELIDRDVFIRPKGPKPAKAPQVSEALLRFQVDKPGK
jgi:serine/threonine protein kinase